MLEDLFDPSSIFIVGIISFFVCFYLLIRAFKFKSAPRFVLGTCFALVFVISSFYVFISFSESNFYVADETVSPNAPSCKY